MFIETQMFIIFNVHNVHNVHNVQSFMKSPYPIICPKYTIIDTITIITIASVDHLRSAPIPEYWHIKQSAFLSIFAYPFSPQLIP